MDRKSNTGANPATTSGLVGRLLRGGLWATIARLSKGFAALALNIILVRLLTIDEIGQYFFCISFATVISLSARMGMGKAVMRLCAEAIATDKTGPLRDTIIKTFSIATLGCVFFGLTYIYFSDELSNVFSNSYLLSINVIIALYILLLAYQRLIADALRGLRQIREAVFFDGPLYSLFALVVLTIVYILGVSVDLQTTFILLVATLSVVVALGMTIISRRLSNYSVHSRQETQKIWSIGWPQMLVELSLYNLSEAAILILAVYESQENVALYGIALRLMIFLRFSQFVVNSVIPPIIAELNVTGNKEQLATMLRSCASLVTIIGVVVAIIYCILGEAFVGILFGEEYIAANPIILILLVGQLVNLSVGSCGQVLMMTGHQKALMAISAVTLASTVLISIAVAERYGVYGVAAIFSLSTIVQSIATLVAVKYYVGIWTHAMFPTVSVVKNSLELVRKKR